MARFPCVTHREGNAQLHALTHHGKKKIQARQHTQDMLAVRREMKKQANCEREKKGGEEPS